MPLSDELREQFPQIMATLAAAELKDPKVALPNHPDEAVRTAFSQGLTILSSLGPNEEDPWNKVPIRQIIRKSTRYIVFLDDKLDVRWWWLLMPQDTQLLGIVQARIAQLAHDSAFLLTTASSPFGLQVKKHLYDSKVTANDEARNVRALIGESLALVLNGGTAEQCEKVLTEARQLIEVAKDRLSRPVFFWGFLLTVLFIAGITAAWHSWGELCCGKNNYEFVMAWLEAATAGAFGAMISAMARTRQLALEPSAGTMGLYVEAGARAAIGAGAGILMGFGFDSGLIGKGALQPGTWETARLFLCVAAGASERILPSLIAKAENMATAVSTSTAPTPAVKTSSGPKTSDGAPPAQGQQVQQQGPAQSQQQGQQGQTPPRAPDSPDVLPD